MSEHVKTTNADDGGCMVCDECDREAGHNGVCDCHCGLSWDGGWA